MEKDSRSRLLEINQKFYDRFAPSFSATRARVQPGVRRLMKNIDRAATVLDVGCGNATLARALAASNFSGRYLGVDMSEALLANAASEITEATPGEYQFHQVDLSDPDWVAQIPGVPYDCLTCFAVLHHLPGKDLREQTTKNFARLVESEGWAAVSVWQWQKSPRLRKRVLPWSEVGLDPEELDPGDVLLDWRAGETLGLRYVHTFNEAELSALAHCAGFRVRESFFSDGKSGDLALYQVWQLVS